MTHIDFLRFPSVIVLICLLYIPLFSGNLYFTLLKFKLPSRRILILHYSYISGISDNTIDVKLNMREAMYYSFQSETRTISSHTHDGDSYRGSTFLSAHVYIRAVHF